MSLFSVGMNLTRTFCSCKYLSLKAESCALKSNSYVQVCPEQRSSQSLSFILTTRVKNKAIAYPPSSLMGNNKNTRLLDPQTQSSFLVSLQKHYTKLFFCGFSPRRMKRRETVKEVISFWQITFSKKQSCWS